MIDFRSADERDAERFHAQAQQADYKRQYENVLAENRELQAKLSGIEGKFGDIVAEFETLKGQFSALETQMVERSAELLRMSEAMQEMVANGYQQQTDLMERFRGDISQRLTKASEATPGIEHKDG